MPLQNRVTPFGEIVATPERGTLFGNRGGRIHDPATRTLLRRRYTSRRWICCVLDFKGRRRDVWGRFYTELFFLYEPTRLAASSAAAKTRRRLPKNGAKCTSIAGRHTQRRWTTCCTQNV